MALGRIAGEEFDIGVDAMASIPDASFDTVPDIGMETMDVPEPDFDMSGGMPETDFGENASVTVIPDMRGNVTTIEKNDGDDGMYVVAPGNTLDTREKVWTDASYSHPRQGWDKAQSYIDQFEGKASVTGGDREYVQPVGVTKLYDPETGEKVVDTTEENRKDRHNAPYLEGSRITDMTAEEFGQKYGPRDLTWSNEFKMYPLR